MKTQGHEFTLHAGKVIECGKSYWPDYVRFNLPRDDAFGFALNILRQLEQQQPDAPPVLEIALFGELKRNPEDDLDSQA